MNPPNEPQTVQPLPAPLPHAQVLGYFTALSSPTRVRRIACLGMRAAALWHGVLAALCGGIVYFIVTEHAAMRNTLGDVAMRAFVPLGLAALTFASGVGEWLLARNVELGNRKASLLAGILLVPAILCTCGAILVCAIFVYGFYNNLDSGRLARFLEVTAAGASCLLMVFIALLLGDLAKCLHWIAANPAAEKPPTPFLPGRPNETTP